MTRAAILALMIGAALAPAAHARSVVVTSLDGAGDGTFESWLRTELRKRGVGDPLPRAEAAKRIAVAHNQGIACFIDDDRCLLEFARLVGVEIVVAYRLIPGAQRIADAALVDVTAGTLRRGRCDLTTVNGVNAAQRTVDAMLGRAIVPVPTPVDENAAANEPLLPAPVLWIGGGALAVVGVVGFAAGVLAFGAGIVGVRDGGAAYAALAAGGLAGALVGAAVGGLGVVGLVMATSAPSSE